MSAWGRNDKVAMDTSGSAMDTSGSAMDTSGSAMETDATDRRVCFVLFRKFTKEVRVQRLNSQKVIGGIKFGRLVSTSVEIKVSGFKFGVALCAMRNA